jgi:hypothetical protein
MAVSLVKIAGRLQWILALVLCGCFASQEPLLRQVATPVTPLPDAFTARVGQASWEVSRDGQTYRATNSDGSVAEETYFDVGLANGMLVLESYYPNVQKPGAIYSYVQIAADGRSVRTSMPGKVGTSVTAALSAAGVAFEPVDDFHVFDDPEALIAALKIGERHLEPPEVRYILLAGETLDPMAPNDCDRLAAHPDDPERKAEGVAFDSIPATEALSSCQDAVALFPDSGRFRFQLGRSQERADRPADALRSYQAAAERGHARALVNIGLLYAHGKGVTPDHALATDFYRRAQALGIDVSSLLGELVFVSAGYSNPAFFDAIYRGETGDIQLKQVGFYLNTFLGMFVRSAESGCSRVVGAETLGRVVSAGTVDIFGDIFGGLLGAHDQGGSRDEMFGQGFEGGINAFGPMLADDVTAENDAQLFYERHGCESPVARRFFGNLEDFVASG